MDKDMIDPCEECLVKVTCWQLCDEKKNYDTLLSNALSQYNNPIIKYLFKEQIKHYRELIYLNNKSMAKISKRAMLMSKQT